jgi:hypothetical protein
LCHDQTFYEHLTDGFELKMKSILSGIVASMVASSAAIAGDAKGVWLSQDGTAKVRLTDLSS